VEAAALTRSRAARVRRYVVIVLVLVVAVAYAVWRPSTSHPAGHRSGPEEILVDLGDVVRVRDGAVGCRVTRRAEFPGQTILDCRRAGARPGTFGAFLGDSKLLVARFGAGRTAKVVFSGTHKGELTTCR
jgi:hypothetical protein